jgi:hypothetical protein
MKVKLSLALVVLGLGLSGFCQCVPSIYLIKTIDV